jgi:tetratricopeptide (TPR) repeat protein
LSNNIALFLHKTYGKYQHTISLYQKLVKLNEAIEEKIISYNNLALLYKEIGENQKALTLYKKVINLLESHLQITPIKVTDSTT